NEIVTNEGWSPLHDMSDLIIHGFGRGSQKAAKIGKDRVPVDISARVHQIERLPQYPLWQMLG
ncbi:MAG: hypothetical protein VX331_02015, partial [Candidatus Thermoplasmatota archaeon]|nr:hypothetical protein [Candidatus Thermoplasmatota archaeon]